MPTKYDFIAIGDTVTDAFIHLKDASAHVAIDKGNREICMNFGDKIPYDEVIEVVGVGNSANAAASAAKLGLKSALVTNVGDDYFGKQILEAHTKAGIATEFEKTHTGRKTNYHYVLWYNDDRTILVKHQEYDYALPDIGEPAWIYLSSLGENSLPLHEEIAKYLAAHPNVKLAFQPGTYQMKFGKEKLAGIYRRTEAFFCNKEEAQRILGVEESDMKKLLQLIAGLGPKHVFITDGPNGAYGYNGTEAVFMPPYPDPKPPVQRTGAGDAFSSTVTVALSLGKDFKEAIRWGPINSMSVVQKVGAQTGLITRVELEEFLSKASEDYKPKKI